MKRIFLLVTIGLILTACSSEVQMDSNQTQDKLSNAELVVPNRLLTVEIEGMVCEMGCGGSIRKDLKAAGGVSDVTFDYKEDRNTNFVAVTYDSQRITEQEMIERLSNLNDGQFTVGEKESEEFQVEKSNEKNEAKSSEDSKIDVASSSGFEIPNLLDLLSGLLLR
jgi:Cu+-exporting ATPase